MPVHRMFLKGPWEVRRLDRDEPSRRVTLPASWQTIFEGSSCGRAEFRRMNKGNRTSHTSPHIANKAAGIR